MSLSNNDVFKPIHLKFSDDCPLKQAVLLLLQLDMLLRIVSSDLNASVMLMTLSTTAI